MPTALPAMRGRFGSTEYFLVTLAAKELADRLVIPKEMPGWEDLTLEERFQRDVNFGRVRAHIAPYLANDPDRFFGAFIVAIYNDEDIKFEPISAIIKELPGLYQQAGKQFGFLYFQGNEVLVPLDGQHRLAAIRFAISGKDEKSRDIPGMQPNLDVAKDQCTVILVKHDRVKSRKIFNKVNRYAKATSKADNLITADDDIVAVIAREEISDKIIHERLVKWDANTLNATAPEFTTLSVVYEGTLALLSELNGKVLTTALPSAADQALYRSQAKDFWSALTQGIREYQIALNDPMESGDEKRRELRKDITIMKPIVQLALVHTILRLQCPGADGTKISNKETYKRINDVDWSVSNPLLQRVLMNGDKVITGRQAMLFASRFLSYYLGEQLEKKELQVLGELYSSLFSPEPKKLPKPLF